MKNIALFVFLILIVSCGNGKEKRYTGSTPAGKLAREFLGIPVSDSVDFIRWKLVIRNDDYELHCNYGVGKNNTNGFINGGKNVDLKGALKKKKIITSYIMVTGR